MKHPLPNRTARRRSGSRLVAMGLLAASVSACGPRGAATADRPDVPAVATLQALGGGGADRCGADAKLALDAIGGRYPAAPEVATARRAYYSTCGEWQALADMLAAIPAASRSEADTVTLARVDIRYLQKFAEGETLVRPLVAAQPSNLDLASLLAASLYYQQRFAEAVPMVDALWQQVVASRNVDIMTMRAEAFLNEGNADRAIRVLNEVLAYAPQHEFGRAVLSRAMAVKGDASGAAAVQATTDAIRAAREAEVANATWVNDRLAEMRAAFDAKRFDESERMARSIIPHLPENRKHEMYDTLGDILGSLGRFDDATKAKRVATALAAGTPESAIAPADRP